MVGVRTVGFWMAALAAGVLCAPRAAAADDPGYVRQFLAIGNWRDVDESRRLVGLDELPFEGHMTLGRLWTIVAARDDGFVDLNTLGPVSPETALAHLYVYSEAPRAYRLLMGSDDRAHVFLNGRRIHQADKRTTWQPDQEKIDVRLEKGWNRLLLRVESSSGAFGFSVRFALPDGRPVRLRTSTAVPDEWLERPQLARPLSAEGVDDLLELLAGRINSVAGQAVRMLRTWEGEGEALDASYAQAREHAADYVRTLQQVLDTLPAGQDDKQEAEAARRQLEAAALRGPYQVAERTAAFLRRASRGSRLWEMVRFSASSAYAAGGQAAELDRALVEARGLLDAVSAEYLRPYRLREETLKHRTAAVQLRLADRDEIALAGAEVSVEQLSHRFAFGCNLFAYGAFDDERQEQQYLERFLGLFNLAVVPTYWSLLEPTEGKSDYVKDPRALPGPEPMIEWCRAHGLRVMAGPLLSNEIRPLWLRDKPPEEAARRVEAHVRELVGRFSGRVDYWDVTGGAWPTLAFGRLRVQASYAFRWAAEADPEAQLLATHAAPYALVVAARLQERQPFGLGGIALAAWQAGGAWPEEELDAHLARLGRYKVPLYVSRVMIPGPAKDEALQARQVEAFYRTALAHPAVAGIIWWDLSDRFARRGAPGGLLRKDLSPKPAYEALARLVRREWWTDAEGLTDDRGHFSFRGFFGRYRVRATTADGGVAVWEFELGPGTPADVDLVYPPEQRGDN